MRIQLLLLSLTIAFASNLPRQSAASPQVETKYLIELPDAFVKTLNTDETGKANLWHPKLTLTKVHSVQGSTNVAGQEKKANNPTPQFASFLQIKQTNSATDSLTYISGEDSSVVASSKMNCGCRFVKDPNGLSFIQTEQTVSVGSTNSQLQAATSFIEKEDKEVSVPEVEEKSEEKVSLIEESQKLIENDLEEKATVSALDDDAELKALLEKKERMKKMEEDLEKELAKEQAKREQEKLMVELLEKEKAEKAKQQEEDKELAALLEKKKMLQELQAEEEAYKEKLRKQEEEKELMMMLEKQKKQLDELKELERMRELENSMNEKNKMAMLLEETQLPTYNNRDSFDEMLLAELREKESRPSQDKFQSLFEDMPGPRYDNNNNNDDLAEFLEFSQRYQQYKSLLTQQQSNQKNRRMDFDMGGYGTTGNQNDRDLELLKKIKAVEDKSLRQELIEALLNE